MRQWQVMPDLGGESGAALAGMIGALGEPAFESTVLSQVQPWLPAASWAVYRTGPHCPPAMFLSASHGIPDRTRDCWWAYLSGPYRRDGSFGRPEPTAASERRLCHVTSCEVPPEHRALVYEAHGMVERVSVVEQEDDALFAVNFYRHEHQPAFTDAQIASFESLALPLLALTRKHIAMTAAAGPGTRLSEARCAARSGSAMPPGRIRERLLEMASNLTPRELDVCVRLLQGLTHEGVASDLGLSCTTVKTYRNRAFGRLGVNFRNELFARVLGVGTR